MSLNEEQQLALDELMRHLPAGDDDRPLSAAPSSTADLLLTFLGLSRSDLKTAVATLKSRKSAVQGRLLDWVEANPLDATCEFLAGAAWAYYKAERHANPKVKTYVDALYYISTCASVGYAEVFPVTQTGRAIASLVMTVGPALTGKTLDRPQERV